MDLTSKSFWESFYDQKQRDEWYFSSHVILDFLTTYIIASDISLRNAIVLNCGCGTALLPLVEQKFNLRWVQLNFDYSLKSLNNTTNYCEAIVADARKIPYVSLSFDIIMEKGLFDSITSMSSGSNAHDLLTEYRRIIKSNGKIFIFSIFGPNGEHKDMLGLLSHSGFQVDCRDIYTTPAEIPTQDFCFVYILTPI